MPITVDLRSLKSVRTRTRFARLRMWTVVAAVAQSVWCLTTDWTTAVRSPTEAKDFSSSLCVQTRYEAHPASYPMATRGSFPGVKGGRGVTLTTHPHLVPRSSMSRSYISSPFITCMASGWAVSLFFTCMEV
jgi:hypothetical protein